MSHCTKITLVAAAATAMAVSLPAVPAQASNGLHPAAGAVYVLSNQVAGNSVITYHRASDGRLRPASTYPTGGTGTGAGLGSQNAVVVDDAGRHVYAVNAGSDSITSFQVTGSGLRRTSTVWSGGDAPVSISVRGNLAYVLNTGSAGSISAFRVHDGRLTHLAGSTRTLSSSAAGAAEVAISPDRRDVVVTEKATSLIDIYPLDPQGYARSRHSVLSVGATPFGFSFTSSGKLAVSEAGPSAVSTYAITDDGLRTLSGSVGNTEAAACWVVVTDDGRFVYTGNGGGSQSVSGYHLDRHGALGLFSDGGKTASAPAGVSDIALSADNRFLYARLGDGTVGAFAVGRTGTLSALPITPGLPAGAAGIAAR
jgi:6-phosphogluconolactonase (cycloisomerase 2 family)